MERWRIVFHHEIHIGPFSYTDRELLGRRVRALWIGNRIIWKRGRSVI